MHTSCILPRQAKRQHSVRREFQARPPRLLAPAAQLLACYCTILLVHAWTSSSWQIAGRLALFSGLSLILIYRNPFASTVYLIAQAEGGAHINLFGNRLAQILLMTAGVVASILAAISRTNLSSAR